MIHYITDFRLATGRKGIKKSRTETTTINPKGTCRAQKMKKSSAIQGLKGYFYFPNDKEAVLRPEIYAGKMAHPQTGCAFFIFQKRIKPTQNWKRFFYRAQKGYAQGTQSYLIDGLDKLPNRLVGIDTVRNIFGRMP